MSALNEALPPFKNHSPATWYAQAVQCPGFAADAAQAEAIRHLDALWQELMAFKHKRNRFLGRSLRSPAAPRGLYIWGGVGRGKSLLMDVFYATLPYRRKRRSHFHAFMADIHARLKTHKGRENPLATVAAEIAREVRVLCFDEFHVSDIADALILGRLLEGLFAHGVVLVATSNYAPQDLYPQGQNRSSFLPTIALLEEQLTVLPLPDGEDFRQRTLSRAEVFYIPANPAHEAQLATLFAQIALAPAQSGQLAILGRTLAVKGLSKEAVWFDFAQLCDGPRSQNDYLALARRFGYVFVSGIPCLDASKRDAARRLTWLVDVLYDFRVKLCATFEAEPEALYPAGDFAGEFVRTASRLTEMRSHAYLSEPYLGADHS